MAPSSVNIWVIAKYIGDTALDLSVAELCLGLTNPNKYITSQCKAFLYSLSSEILNPKAVTIRHTPFTVMFLVLH